MASTQPHLLHPKYRADIDGLRAVAVLSVVAFHAFPGWVRGGFIGVDVFFVISGFLISTIIFENLEQNRFSFSEFYARRIRRIFPALIVVLVACFAFGWFALLDDEYKQLGKHMAAGAAFISNFVFWNEAGYFDNEAITKPLLHLWSLGIEEQFYILWPVLVWLAWKRRLRLLLITAVASISLYLNLRGVSENPVATFYSPQTRFWELLAGSALAWLAIQRRDALGLALGRFDGWSGQLSKMDPKAGKRLIGDGLSLLGISLLLYGFYRIDREASFPGAWAVVPVLGAVLLIAAGPSSLVNRAVLSNRVMVWFGLISFPLYLWHWPLLSFAEIVESGDPGGSVRVAAVVTAVALSWLTYVLIERPLRRGENSWVRVAALAGIMGLLGGLGYFTYQRDGLASLRLKEFRAQQNIVAKPRYRVAGFECDRVSEFRNLTFDGKCQLSKDADPTILFVGDSHMAQYRTAVWGSFQDETVLMVAQTSCLPFSGEQFMVGDCLEKYNAVIRFIERAQSVRTVVLSGHWAYLMSGGFETTGRHWRIAKAASAAGVKTFKTHGTRLIATILRSGKQVVFMKDIPDLDFDIQTCFDSRPLRLMPVSNVRHDCWMEFGKYTQRAAPYDNVVDGLLGGFPSVAVYSPRGLFCKDGRCFGTDGLMPYYANGDHVNYHGGRMVIDDLRAKVRFSDSARKGQIRPPDTVGSSL